MRIVLTGATGFIGRELVRLANEEGHQLITLVRNDSAVKALSDYPIQILNYYTLEDPELISNLKSLQPDVFIHLAWKGVIAKERMESFQFIDNIPFTLASVQLAALTGCKVWIGTGSQAEYGIANNRLSENHNCIPITAYGKAKLASGIASLGLCEALNITGAWLRLFSIYGPHDHSTNLIPYVINCLKKELRPELTACEQQWDFLHVTDAARAYLAIAENNLEGVYNIGAGKTVHLKQVIESIKKQINSGIDISYDKPYSNIHIMHLEADISKLSKCSNWKPCISLTEGLSQTINYYLSESI